MPTTANFKNLIQYTTLAGITAMNIGEKTQVPFLCSTATLCSSILKCIEVIQFCGNWHNTQQKRIDNQIKQGRSCGDYGADS
jgi:hypothetical protein